MVTAYANLIAYKIVDEENGDKMVAELLLQNMIVHDFQVENVLPLPIVLSPSKKGSMTTIFHQENGLEFDVSRDRRLPRFFFSNTMLLTRVLLLALYSIISNL